MQNLQKHSKRFVIVISGTPGTGKTHIAKALSKILNGIHIELSKFVIERKLYTSYDNERKSYVIDENKVREELSKIINELKDKNIIVDGHYGELTPNPDIIIILRLHPLELERRLKEKSWDYEKVRENVAAEILGVCLSNAISEHGIDKIYEIDVTNKSLDEILKEIKSRFL